MEDAGEDSGEDWAADSSPFDGSSDEGDDCCEDGRLGLIAAVVVAGVGGQPD